MKNLFRNVLYRLGFQLRRINEITSFEFQRNRLLVINDIDVCIDCGANVGSYAQVLRNSGFDKAIISIEPSSAAYRKLCSNSAKDKNWRAYRYAVGDKAGVVALNITNNSVSTSLLSPKQNDFNISVGAIVCEVEMVELIRIDQFAEHYLTEFKRLFLKFDVQGYESLAIQGAASILDRVPLIEIEICLDTLYEGASDWLSMINQLRGLGYELIGTQQNTVDQNTARTLEVNAIFYKAV